MQTTVVARIEGPVQNGTIVDTPEGIRRVKSIEFEKDSGRSVLKLEKVITEEPARAVYPVLCPKCHKVFVYGVEPERFISIQDMDTHKRGGKFFVMPGLCQMCSSDGNHSFTS